MVRFLDYFGAAVILILAFAAISFVTSILLVLLDSLIGVKIVGVKETLYFVAGVAGFVFIVMIIFGYVYTLIVGEEE